jgi:excisionase family DNA binding protein
MLTPSEVAARLRVDRETVYRHIRDGTLRAARIGRSYRVDEAVLDDFVAAAGGPRGSRLAGKPLPFPGGSEKEALDSTSVSPARLTPEQRARAIQLIAQWRAEADDPEHAESWEFLKSVLDEDRLSDRRLFS